ncbi:MAG TPA: carboxypeptidase regulatory-like domain-containing protein, partial [Bacteroidota bacterium]
NNLEGVRYLIERGRGPGLTGHVVDARTGKPLEATVWFPGIETDDVRRRTTEATFGRYWRLLAPGKYAVIVSAPGHRKGVFKEVTVGASGWTSLEVRLEPGQEETNSE